MKEGHIVSFHLYEMPIIGKCTETGCRLAAGGWGGQGDRGDCSVGKGYPLG